MNPRPLTVLVDNDDDKRFLLLRRLRREFPSLEVRAFSDTASAAEILKSPDVALLITNGRIGLEDGLAFVTKVRAQRPDLPIILVTLRGDLENQAKKAGVTAFVMEDDPNAVHQAIHDAIAEVA